MKTLTTAALLTALAAGLFVAPLALSQASPGQSVRLISDLETSPDLSSGTFEQDSAVLSGPNLFISTDGVLSGSELWRLRILAQFNGARGLATDSAGNVWVSDTVNHVIRRVGSDGVVTTVAGRPGVSGTTDGLGLNARFNLPTALFVDRATPASSPLAGSVYVVDTGNHRIRRIASDGVVSTVAGSTDGYRNSLAGSPLFSSPEGITGAALNIEAPTLFVADTGNHAIRRLQYNALTKVWTTTTYAGPATKTSGYADVLAASSDLSAARFNQPAGVEAEATYASATAATPNGFVLYVADRGNGKLRRIQISTTTTVRTVGVDLQAPQAVISDLRQKSTAASPAGLFILEPSNHSVRRVAISSAATLAGTATLVAGGSQGVVNGGGATAKFNNPFALTMLREDLIVADTGNHSLRLIDLPTSASAPLLATVSLWSGRPGLSGSMDGGSDPNALDIALNEPPVVLTDAVFGRGGSDPSRPVPMQRTGRTPLVFFSALDDTGKRQLWCSDGTPTGTKVLGASVSALGSLSPEGGMAALGQTLLFVAVDQTKSVDILWQLSLDASGNPTEPVPVLSSPGSEKIAEPSSLTVVGDRLFMSARELIERHNGAELWVSAPAAPGQPRTAYEVQDLRGVNGDQAGSFPNQFTAYNGSVYFNASGQVDADNATGSELFRCSQDASSVELVVDVVTGTGDSEPRSLTVSGPPVLGTSSDEYVNLTSSGRFYFSALLGQTADRGLFRLSGNSLNNFELLAGNREESSNPAIQRIGELAPISVMETPVGEAIRDNGLRHQVIFAAQDTRGDLGVELYKYNNARNELTLLKDITTTGSPSDSNLDHFTSLSSHLVVFTNQNGPDLELWATNGASGDATVKLRTFTNSTFRAAAKVGSSLYFMAGVDELWGTNGFETWQVCRFRQTNQGSAAANYTSLGSGRFALNTTRVIPAASPGGDETTETEMRVMNLATGEFVRVPLPDGGGFTAVPDSFISIGSARFLFQATRPNDGDAQVTDTHLMLALPNAEQTAYSCSSLMLLDGFGSPLWVPGLPSPSPVTDRLYFRIRTAAAGSELAWIDTANLTGAAVTPQVIDINAGSTRDSNPDHLLLFDGKVWFSAQYSLNFGGGETFYGSELFAFDPAANAGAGRLLRSSENGPLAELGVGEFDGDVRELVAIELPGMGTVAPYKRLFFAANGSADTWRNAGREVFVTSGKIKANGSFSLLESIGLTKDIAVNAQGTIVNALDPVDNHLTAVDRLLYFTADDGIKGVELWRSNGTAAGTVLVRDINPNAASSNPRKLTRAAEKLFFVADDATQVGGLWVIATAGGQPQYLTTLEGISDLVAVGDMVCFAANTPGYGRELWVSDGTLVGTRLLTEFTAGLGSSMPHSLLAASDRELLLTAQDEVHGDEPRSIVLAADMQLSYAKVSGATEVLQNAYGLPSVPAEATIDLTEAGALRFGSNAAISSVRLLNVGSRVIRGISARVEGVHAAEFVIRAAPANTLSFEQSSSIGIQFVPREGGLREAKLIVQSNDEDNPIFEVLLKGTCSKDPTVDNSQLLPLMRRVGESARFPVSATSTALGNPAGLGLQWFLNGRALAGGPQRADQAELYLPAVRLTDAGSYQARFTRDAREAKAAGIGSSNSVVLGVAEDYSPARLVHAKAGSRVSMTCNAAGAGLSYAWELLGGTLPAGSVGANTRTLTLNAVSDAFEGTYRCLVSNVGGSVTAGSTTLVVYAGSDLPGALSAPTLPAGRVGAPYAHSLRSHLTGGAVVNGFVASGLPPGLRLDALSGAITGVPSRAGSFAVKLGTRLGTVASSLQDVTVLIAEAPAGIDGVYHGWVARQAGVNDDSGARLELTIGKTGAFSGRMTVGTTATAFVGNMIYPQENPPASGSYRGVATIARALPLTACTLEFEIAENARRLSDGATLTAISANGVSASNGNQVTAAVRAWASATDPTYLANAIGRYHVAMQVSGGARNNAAIPQGAGFLVVTVAANGAVRIEGRTGDGEKITGATFVSPSGQILVYQGLYATALKGSLLAELPLVVASPRTHSRLDGTATWTKPAQTALSPVSAVAATRTYRAGFGLPTASSGLALAVTGGMYAPSPKEAPAVLLNAPAGGATAALAFSKGNLGEPLGPQNRLSPNQSVAIDASSKFTLTPAVPATAAKTVLTAARATGLISGSFVLKDPDATTLNISSQEEITRTVPFNGLVVPMTPSDHRAVGHFLLQQIPEDANGTAFKLGSILSGLVEFGIPPPP